MSRDEDTKEYLMQIGDTLRILREGKKLSQPKLSIHIGVDKQRISQWERGERKIPFKYLKAYSEFFNVSIDSILTGKDFKPHEEKGNDLESMSYIDLIKMIRQLENYGILENITKKEELPHYRYMVNDDVLNFLIISYRRMDALLKDGNISKDIMQTWENGLPKDFDYHLINWSYISQEDILNSDLPFSLNDAEEAYNYLHTFSKKM